MDNIEDGFDKGLFSSGKINKFSNLISDEYPLADIEYHLIMIRDSFISGGCYIGRKYEPDLRPDIFNRRN